VAVQHACSEHVIFKQTQLVTNSLTEWCLLYCRIRYSTYYFLYLSNKVLNHINKKRLELTFYSQDCVVEYVHTKVCEIACSEHCRQHYDYCLCNCDSISSTTITHNIVYIMTASVSLFRIARYWKMDKTGSSAGQCGSNLSTPFITGFSWFY